MMAVVEATVWVALIGLPANLLLAYATYRKANSADRAVNHRLGGTTVSEDVMDIKVEQREMRRDMIWLTREFGNHLREHADGG